MLTHGPRARRGRPSSSPANAEAQRKMNQWPGQYPRGYAGPSRRRPDTSAKAALLPVPLCHDKQGLAPFATMRQRTQWSQTKKVRQTHTAMVRIVPSKVERVEVGMLRIILKASNNAHTHTHTHTHTHAHVNYGRN
jgi:hypothetical protein